MIRIAISPEAFDAIAATLVLGSVGFENAVNERGERLIWLAPNVVNRLKAMRGPGVELQRCDPAGWRSRPLLGTSSFRNNASPYVLGELARSADSTPDLPPSPVAAVHLLTSINRRE